MKNRKWYLLGIAVLAVCAICVGLILHFSGNETPDPTEPEKNIPVLELSKAQVEGMVRTAIELPAVTATDVEDGDLTGNVKLKILFVDDGKYVLPTVNANQGVSATEHPSYTPTKVGTYEITYFVEDSDGNTGFASVVMTVTANDTDDRGTNLAGKDQMANWIVADEKQNSVFNEFGEIVIAGKYGQNYTGAVYTGKKIQNGDTVAFAFQANPLTEVMFYNVSFLLTPSCDADAPTAEEGTWPKYFNMRIGEHVTTFAVTDNNLNFDLLPQINLSLCDGKEHTIALNITADAEKIVTKIWIDADTSGTPSSTGTVYKKDVQKKYGEDTAHLKIFDESISGWLSFGAYCTGADTSNDGMTLKSVAINNSNSVESPELTVGTFDKMFLDKAYSLPTVTAKDAGDYSDITDLVKIYLKAPNGSFEEMDGNSFTPTQVGKYTIRYVVTDRSGNQTYAEYVISCAKGESAEQPTITFAPNVQDSYTIGLGESFTIPTPEKVVDSFGEDIMKNLTVALVGREKETLSAGESIVLRAVGVNTLRYTVEDYNGNVTVKDITLVVTGGKTGNLFAYSDLWYHNVGATLKNESMTVRSGGATFAYGGQKIYDEKVSMLLNLDVMGSGGNDGTNILLIGIRGGKGLHKVPKTEANPGGSDDFSWPDGLALLIHKEYGVILKGEGYNSSDYAVAILPDGTVYDTFNGKDVELSFQATDVYEGDTLKGIRFQLWINGEKVSWSGSYVDENGDVFLSARVVNVNEQLTQAGWLSFYFNEVDTVNSEQSIVKSLTIDGTRPVELTVSADKEENQKFEIGKSYTLPKLTVFAGDEDVSATVKKYIWIEGQPYPDLTGAGYTKETLVPDATHIKGFTVVYAYEGKEIKQISVRNATPATVKLAQSSYTAELGKDFTLPSYTASIGSVDVTKDVVVKIQIGISEQVVTGTVYRPTVSGNFTLNYYLYGELVKSQPVTVKASQATGENLASKGYVTPGKAWVYLPEQMYNSQVSLTFTLDGTFTGGNWVDFALRGNEQTPDAWFSWSKGLLVRIVNDATWGTYIKVGYGSENGWFTVSFGESEMKLTDVDWTKEHTLAYSIYDVYDGKTFVGIRIDVSFDGETVKFKDLNNAGFASTSDGSYIMIPASFLETAPAEHFTSSYLFAWGNGVTVNVKEAYLKEK